MALLIAGTCTVSAQSLKNTAWKVFIGGEVNDTLTMHIQSDSSFVSGSNGEVLVRSTWKMSKDTITIRDYDGKYACQGQEGVYKVTVSSNEMTYVLINDACDGRAGAINGIKWTKVK